MKFKIGIATLLLAALAGCGGSDYSVAIGFGDFSIDHPFVIWDGNSNGDQVVDVNNNAFAFYADNGCLYNFRTGRENTQFCLTSGAGTAVYGGFRMRITNVHSVTGTCIAALIDESTGHFIDVKVDSFGKEVIFITALHPDFCVI